MKNTLGGEMRIKGNDAADKATKKSNWYAWSG